MSCVSSTRAAPTFSRCWTRSCKAFSTFSSPQQNASADELVARSVNRQNESRFLRLGFDFLPKANNVRVHRARRGKAIVSPDILEQPIAAQGFSGMNQEIFQKLELFRRKIQRMTLARHLATAQINFDLAKGIFLFRTGSGFRTP